MSEFDGRFKWKKKGNEIQWDFVSTAMNNKHFWQEVKQGETIFEGYMDKSSGNQTSTCCNPAVTFVYEFFTVLIMIKNL